MFGTVLAVIKARKIDNPHLFEIFCDIRDISDYIIVSDEDRLLAPKEREMLLEYFDVLMTTDTIDEINMGVFNPDWILSCYSDERPAHKQIHLYTSLCLNPDVNVWKSKCRFLWESEEYYRADGQWNKFEFPILYRYCPEINYKWKKALMPANQPGPKEDWLLPFYSYHFIDERSRLIEYTQRQEEWDKMLMTTKTFYESMFDETITLKKAVN
ncbi:MAG: hypothetical protein WC375_09100 [Methanomassiliicoccales archaeon]|jgi:hypothetical protein